MTGKRRKRARNSATVATVEYNVYVSTLTYSRIAHAARVIVDTQSQTRDILVTRPCTIQLDLVSLSCICLALDADLGSWILSLG